MTQHTLDARNLLCPMPVIRLQQAMENYAVGDVVEVLCTDPGTQYDIPSWCKVHGHQVSEINTEERIIKITVQVGS